MANPEHLAKLREGVNNWNRWRDKNPDIQPDLSEVDLCGTDLTMALLAQTNLFNANLTDTNLSGVIFVNAELSGAIINGANLTIANLNMANLRGTTLREAVLERAMFGWTTFADVDLSRTRALETCSHLGPSTIGVDTIYKSKGEIPEVFLRGIGVPEQFITYARSLVGQAIEFYSCFISYSSWDQAIAARLNAELRAKNLRCWFAPEDLKIGDRFHERIEESIRLYDKVMIILSEESVKSRWVEREVNAAREREDCENRTVLFPIRIDDAVMDATAPWAADLRRTRHIGDFTKWKDHDSYQAAFERLLRDLKTDTSGATSAT